MLCLLRQLIGAKVYSEGQTIGEVSDFFFDHRTWAIQFFLIRVGGLFRQKSILIRPSQIESMDGLAAFTLKDNVMEQSLILDRDYSGHYRWPYYWTGAGVLGIATHSEINHWGIAPQARMKLLARDQTNGQAIGIDSFNGILDFRIESLGTLVGYLEDFVIDTRKWKISYLVIRSLPSPTQKTSILPPEWIETIQWNDLSIRFSMKEEVILKSPEFHSKILANPYQMKNFENALWQYYQIPRIKDAS